MENKHKGDGQLHDLTSSDERAAAPAAPARLPDNQQQPANQPANGEPKVDAPVGEPKRGIAVPALETHIIPKGKDNAPALTGPEFPDSNPGQLEELRAVMEKDRERLALYNQTSRNDQHSLYDTSEFVFPYSPDSVKFNHHRYHLVEDPKHYIAHVTQVSPLFKDDTIRPTPKDREEIVTESTKAFPNGTASVALAFSDALFTHFGVRTDRSLPMSGRIFNRANTDLRTDEELEVLSAYLIMLFVITQDRRIASRSRHIDFKQSSIPTIIRDMITGPVMVPLAPHLSLIVFDTPVAAVSDRLREILALPNVNYKLGQQATIDSTSFPMKTWSTYNVNMDTLTASILNMNASNMMRAKYTIEEKAAELAAYTIGGARIDIGVNADYILDLPPSGERDLNRFCLFASRYNMTEDLILSINTGTLVHSNFIQPIKQDYSIPKSLGQDQAMSNVRNYLSNQMDQVQEAQISQWLAMEMTPILCVRDMAPITFTKTNPDECACVLVQLSLWAMVSPGRFDIMKGCVQGVIFDLLDSMAIMEKGFILNNYGTTVTYVNGEVVPSPGNRTRWSQSNLFAGVYPSFWEIPSDLMKALPVSLLIRSLFRPLGVMRDDTKAVDVGFPRFPGARHYMPFVREGPGTYSLMSERFYENLTTIKELFAIHSKAVSTPKAVHSPVLLWLDHVGTMFEQIAPAFTQHLGPLYAEMANYKWNLLPNAEGGIRMMKRSNYGIFHKGGRALQMVHDMSGDVTSSSKYSSAYVWNLLFHTTYVNVDREVRVPNNQSRLSVADPKIAFNASNSLTDIIYKSSAVDTFMSSILSLMDVIELDRVTSQQRTIDFINRSHFNSSVAPFLEAYGRRVLTIDINTTPAQITAFALTSVFMELKFLDGEVVADNVRLALSTVNSIIVFSDLLEDAIGKLFINPFAYSFKVVRPMGPTIHLEHAYGIGDDLRKLVAMFPPLRDSQILGIHDALAATVNQQLAGYGEMMVRYLGERSQGVVPKYLRIRRIGPFNTEIDFDPNVDPPGFQWVHSLMEDDEIDRLVLGLNFVLRDTLSCIYTGLRLSVQTIRAFNPNYVPATGMEPIPYSPKLFTNSPLGLDVKRCFIDPVTQERIFCGRGMALRYITIPNSSNVNPIDASFLLHAIEEGWFVDVLDVRYTSSVVGHTESPTNPTTQDILRNVTGQVLHVTFKDSSFALPPSNFTPITSGDTSQTIFPLESMMRNVIARSLARTNTTLPPGFSLPSAEYFDTGVEREGLIYHSDNTLKTDSDIISMTNPVIYAERNTILDGHLSFIHVPPNNIDAIVM